MLGVFFVALLVRGSQPHSADHANENLPLPVGTKCVVVNTTNTGSINLTCNMAREHEDGIKQGNFEVGRADGFSVGKDRTTVHFDSIRGSEDFDNKRDFMYNGMTIGDCAALSVGRVETYGKVVELNYADVTCKRRTTRF